jgi:hypothetical protein
MASQRFSSGDAVEKSEPVVGTTSGSDANSSTDNKDADIIGEKTEPPLQETGDKKEPFVQETKEGNTLPVYADLEAGEEHIHHPADKDDILTHTIHVEDDPTLSALTFRTWFLGMSLSPLQVLIFPACVEKLPELICI